MPPKETQPAVGSALPSTTHTTPAESAPTTVVSPPATENQTPPTPSAGHELVLKDHYRVVHDIQEFLKNNGPKKAVEPKDLPEALEELRTGCNALRCINFKKLTSPFHQALYTLLLVPYKSELTTYRNIGNGWHVGWRDASLLSLRQCLVGVITALHKISASEKPLDEAQIALIDMCLLAHFSLIAKELSWHGKIRDISYEIQAQTVPHPDIKRAAVLKSHDAASFELVDEMVCVTHENAALQARVDQLTKKAEVKESELCELTETHKTELKKKDEVISSLNEKQKDQDTKEKELNEIIKKQGGQLSALSTQVKALAEKGGIPSSAAPAQPTPPSFSGNPLHGGSDAQIPSTTKTLQ